ncbi:MAG: FAD-dependent oxidoreductase, partial [Alphaproteobacteria bacterium]
MADYDVIVVGAGNAAHAAAYSAKENGAEKVLILEKASKEDRGGNTYYSGGLLRIAFEETLDLKPLVPDAEDEIAGFFDDVEAYTSEDFMADIMRVTSGKTDKMLANILVSKSYETILWMKETVGVPMEPATSLAAIKVGNRIKWQKGAIIRAEHEGVGLSTHWFKVAEEAGIEVRYGSGMVGLLEDDSGAVSGVRVRGPEGIYEVTAKAIVLGCGGFEANPMMRAQYLGAPWDHAKVRGTAHNQGDGLRLALDIGAQSWGQWSGRHSTPISNEWPDFA